MGAALGLDKRKLTEGKELIRYFCVPGKDGTRHVPASAPEKWVTFKAYNLRDVETELAIQKRLQKYPVPEEVWAQYHLDQQINDRGIAVDRTLVRGAIDIDERSREELTARLRELTMLDNPNSVQQMKDWLAANGLQTDTLGKKQVAELLKTAPEPLKSVLVLRQQLAKSSVKKYQAMENAVCADGRVRGCFQFYGARTGRWAGRNIQLQNLPQNRMPDLEQARSLVRAGDYDSVRLLYDSTPDVLSQLIRTALIPSPGKTFFVSDFSAIEARVIAWLAGEQWRQQVFAEGKDIYCASASQMFGVPVEKHGVNGHLRQKGKIAELALGYGGSVGALKAMGAIEMGLKEDELKPLVDAWRNANPMIVKLWWEVDRAVTRAVSDKTATETHGIRFTCQSGMLFIALPSGRQLAYVKPRIGENQFGGSAITYMGTNAAKQWARLESYGPKFVENIVQAISRDILCLAMPGAAGLRDCGACPRRGDPRSRSQHVAGSGVRADGQDAALGTGPSAARGRVRHAVLQKRLTRMSTKALRVSEQKHEGLLLYHARGGIHMFYVKSQIENSAIVTEITDENVFTPLPGLRLGDRCGSERSGGRGPA